MYFLVLIRLDSCLQAHSGTFRHIQAYSVSVWCLFSKNIARLLCFVIGAKSKQHFNILNFPFSAYTKLHVHGVIIDIDSFSYVKDNPLIQLLKLTTYLLVWSNQNLSSRRSAVQIYFPLQSKQVLFGWIIYQYLVIYNNENLLNIVLASNF